MAGHSREKPQYRHTFTLNTLLQAAPKDPILGITEKFLADRNPAKINLGVVRTRLWPNVDRLSDTIIC